MPGTVPGQPRSFSRPALRPRSDAGSGCRRPLHLPDGSGGPPARPRRVSQVWHGARAPYRHAGRGSQPGTPPHDAAILDQPGVDGAADRRGNVSHAGRAFPRAHYNPEAACLDRVDSCNSRGSLGRLAFLPARLGFYRQPQPQHVHAHRHGYGHGLPLQRPRHCLAANLPAIFPPLLRRSPGVFRVRRHNYDAGASGAGARVTRP